MQSTFNGLVFCYYADKKASKKPCGSLNALCFRKLTQAKNVELVKQRQNPYFSSGSKKALPQKSPLISPGCALFSDSNFRPNCDATAFQPISVFGLQACQKFCRRKCRCFAFPEIPDVSRDNIVRSDSFRCYGLQRVFIIIPLKFCRFCHVCLSQGCKLKKEVPGFSKPR